MKYLELFSLELRHEYYSDGRCPDFGIEATPETQRLLRNFRCVLKSFPNGMRVLILVNKDNTPFISSPAGTTFGFHLRLQNTNFILFTDFTDIDQQAAPFYTNDALNPELKLESRAPNSILKRGVFADVEIKVDGKMVDNMTPGGATPFQILFKTKKVRWKYYVVINKTDNKANIPAIEDKDNKIVFDAAGQTDLTRSPDPDDKIAAALAAQYPDMQTFRFLSNDLIPCREAARKSIQFRINGDKVVDALPNPALQNYAVDVSKKEDSLYHIVKYFTHSFSSTGG